MKKRKLKKTAKIEDRDCLFLGQDNLSIEQVVEVARFRQRVKLHPQAKERMMISRQVVDQLVDRKIKAYGITTGFGSLRDVVIDDPEESRQLQANLIRSHSCGVGDPLPEDTVRAMMLLRANTLAQGYSGVRPQIVERLLFFLNADIYPYIPEKGSVGASGDLAPLSHLALVLIGDQEGLVYAPSGHESPTLREGDFISHPLPVNFKITAAQLHQTMEIEPIQLFAKEGLGLNNGTQMMAAVAALNIYDCQRLIQMAELGFAMSLEACKGVIDAYLPEIHQARGLRGQIECAARVMDFISDSELLRYPINLAYLYRAINNLQGIFQVLDNYRQIDWSADESVIPEAQEMVKKIKRELEELYNSPLKVFKQQTGLNPGKLSKHDLWRNFRIITMEHLRRLNRVFQFICSPSFPPEVASIQNLMTIALNEVEKVVPSMMPVQDDYSLRCTPQVYGVMRDTLRFVNDIVTAECNAANDNPLIFPPPEMARRREGASECTNEMLLNSFKSGGNFHGEPLATAMDYLGIVTCQLSNIIERRIAHMLDSNRNNGLPTLLVEHYGLNSGFMIPQYTAAALVSESKLLSHPASVDSIPTCENAEDYVSMGPIAVQKCRRIIENTEHIFAIELICSWQALHFRGVRPSKVSLQPSCSVRNLYELIVQEGFEFVEKDQVPYSKINKMVAMIRSNKIVNLARHMSDLCKIDYL